MPENQYQNDTFCYIILRNVFQENSSLKHKQPYKKKVTITCFSWFYSAAIDINMGFMLLARQNYRRMSPCAEIGIFMLRFIDLMIYYNHNCMTFNHEINK